MKGLSEEKLKFISGGGVMGDQIRRFAWASSTIGLPTTWQLSLLHAVGNMLRTNLPMLLLWGDDLVCFYNDAFIQCFGNEKHVALGKKLQDVSSDRWTSIIPQINNVLSTGEPVSFDNRMVTMRNGNEEINWRFYCSLFLNDQGEAGGVMVVCTDTTSINSPSTETSEREQTLIDAQQTRVYETVISATPDLVYVFDLKYRFTYANAALLTMWGKNWDNAIGKGLRDNGYEEWHAAMHEREIDQVVLTGKSIRGEVSFPHAVLGTRVYDYILVPVFNEVGEVEAVAGTTRDISDIKQIELQLRESEERFRNLILVAPVAIAVFRGKDLIADIANDEYLKLVDKPALEFIGLPLFESLPLVRPVVEPLVRNVIETGQSFIGTEVEVLLDRQGSTQTGFFNLTYSPLYGKNGHADGFMVIANEVTTQVIARRKIEASEKQFREKEAALANAVELAQLGTWRLYHKTGQISVSRRYAEMFGLKQLTLSLDEVLLRVAKEDRERIAGIFEILMHSNTKERFDAEFRIINGTTGNTHIIHALGALFLDELGLFDRIEGTAQDVTEQREIQLALENKVQVRTEELQAINEELVAINEELSESTQLLMQSNEELSQFAYVASHDLQEPVRKISVFVEMLEKTLTNIDDRSRNYLNKIDDSANRMSNLIRDVLAHSQLSKSSRKFELVNLAKVLVNTLLEFEVLFQERDPVLEIDELPVIDAIEVQMSQLFSNLISNALKFSSPDRKLRLQIRSEMVTNFSNSESENLTGKGYYKISFIDNGIGFDQSHAVQIFEIFQRLHTKKEYSGTGIGLATCKKIVQNHGGQISAASNPGEGATFVVILPASQS